MTDTVQPVRRFSRPAFIPVSAILGAPLELHETHSAFGAAGPHDHSNAVRPKRRPDPDPRYGSGPDEEPSS